MNEELQKWKKLCQRAFAMSPKELVERMRQQMRARADLLRYRAGFPFNPSFIQQTDVRREPNFFFSSADVPRLCSRLRELFPQTANEILERANRICEHRFDLLGYKDLDYEPEIDWHADLVHGKHAPPKPWFQIRYLDFSEVGDSKIIWELNRHQHLVTLAKAYRLTGDEKFANELFEQWKHWSRKNPYPIGINWSSSLEVAFRSLSWLWVYFLMAGTAAMPEWFRLDLYGHLGISARHIESHLSTYFSPNTHLIGEATALFFIGTLCPGLRQSKRWQQRGWEILQQEAALQVRDDGFHFEQSTYYHVYALDFYLHSAVLASRNGISISPQFNAILERMLNTICVLGTAGPIAKLGDDDGGRLFDPQRNLREHLLDPLATGAVMFKRGDFKAIAGSLREETLWLLGETGVAEFDRLLAAPPANQSTEFRNTGLYIMADDGGRQLTLDAGPPGADSAGHGHADALSVIANMNGHALLIDSGTFEYVGQGADRNRFRGSKVHNTLVVDGLDQSEPNAPFSWVSLPNVHAEKWIKGEAYDFFAGSHDGYSRLTHPVVHRRSVFSLKSNFWLVRDQALGLGKHQLELFWHIDPELVPTGENKNTFRSADANLLILTPQNHGWLEEIKTENWSPAYGRQESHTTLHLSSEATLPTEFATLVVAQCGTNSSAGNFSRVKSRSAEDSVVCYRFKTNDEEHFIVFGSENPWELSSWKSDAEVLYWSQNHERSHWSLICCNASYVGVNGQKIIAGEKNISRLEVFYSDGKVRVSSSGNNAVFNHEAFDQISLNDFES